MISLSSAAMSAANPAIGDHARRRIRRRLLPYLFLLYVVAYLDRVNVSYGALQMTSALGFTPEVYGFGAGIFFLGYLLLEIPGTILVEKWSARRWIARIMITWGMIAACTGFIHTAHQFYWIRFLLGLAEAGFFPGIVVYVNHWIRREERAAALAAFMLAQPISNLIGSPMSGVLLGIHWFGLAGWRWLFVLEGIPAIILGIVTLWYLTDWPHQAKWLTQEEREWITAELKRESAATNTAASAVAWEALFRPEVLPLCVAYFFVSCSVYGFTFWLPTITKRISGFSNLTVSLIAALPYCVGLFGMLLVSRSSDAHRERYWHTACSMTLIAAGLTLSVAFNGVALPMLMFCLAAAGMYGYLPSFWSIPSSFLVGTAAAACIGLINSIGAIGGFIGPFVVGRLTNATHSFGAGVSFLAASAGAAALLVILVWRIQRTRGSIASRGV